MSFIDKIDRFCQQYHMSHSRFEREAGLARGSIAKWRNSHVIPTFRSQKKIADHMGITTEDLMREDSYDLFRTDGLQADQEPGSDFISEACVRYIPVLRFPSCECSSSPDAGAVTGHIAVMPGTIEAPEKCFGYTIEDSSMASEIEPGDIVIVRRDPCPVSGDVVIAEVPGGDILCRKYVDDGENIILQPYNRHYDASAYRIPQNEKPSVVFDGVVIRTIKSIPSLSAGAAE